MQALTRSSYVAARSGSRALSVSAFAKSNGSGSEGTTAQSKGFSQRERSAEEQYIMQKEREAYRLAKKKLEAQKKKLKESGLSEAEIEQEEAQNK